MQALVITVQVISEAADTCLHTVVHHCHSLKLLQVVCTALCSDKNAKIRLHCSSYLLQVRACACVCARSQCEADVQNPSAAKIHRAGSRGK